MLPAASLGDVLHLAGLGQNLMDAAFTTVIARKHYGNEIDDSELGQRRSRAIKRLLNQLNSELGEKRQDSSISLGEIAIAVALDYLAQAARGEVERRVSAARGMACWCDCTC